jgi:hypothetical protein
VWCWCGEARGCVCDSNLNLNLNLYFLKVIRWLIGVMTCCSNADDAMMAGGPVGGAERGASVRVCASQATQITLGLWGAGAGSGTMPVPFAVGWSGGLTGLTLSLRLTVCPFPIAVCSDQ